MSEEGRSGPPAWAPASVAAAPRHGVATAAELQSGESWTALLDALRRVGDALAGTPPGELPGAYRHLLVLAALGIDEALRAGGDAYDPHISLGNVDAVLKWGMDCPDALYSGASVRSGAEYRITGTRGTARYLGFQVMGGMETLANAVGDDLDVAADGTFELVLSADERPGNWLRLADRASTLIIRQFFYDWNAEVPAALSIERVGGGAAPAATTADEGTAMARRLVALGEFIEASQTFWQDIEAAGRAQGVNSFREPANRTDIGGAEENVTVWGSYELADDEALIIEVTPPEALYWSITLGDPWWKSVDYANHQSSLNGAQALLDSDGVFRAVVASRDPGVANWLDPAGSGHGPMIVRWLRAAATPVPKCTVVPYGDLDMLLPSDTARVDAATRQATIARRRAGVRRRFRR